MLSRLPLLVTGWLPLKPRQPVTAVSVAIGVGGRNWGQGIGVGAIPAVPRSGGPQSSSILAPLYPGFAGGERWS